MSDQIHVDVVIIGGGIMGLWLLKDLKDRNYQAVLLECGQLGGQQTCHSHVYIHQGHIYAKEQRELVKGLRAATAEWSKWIAANHEVRISRDSYFGYENRGAFEDRKKLWTKLDLEAAPRDLSALSALQGGDVKHLVSAQVDCLDGQKLVEALMKPIINSMVRIKDSSLQASETADRQGVAVSAKDTRGKALNVHCRALVFAAGAGNRRLLGLVAGDMPVSEPQLQIRKAHMLVIKGPKDDLPPLVGIFDDFGGLFIVSREASEQENVWLVSDNRSSHIQNAEDWVVYSPRSWLYGVLVNLESISRSVFARAGKFCWGIYEAPKAEAKPAKLGQIPEEEYIHPCSERVWAVWPTKLTLAPQASSKLIGELKLGAPVDDAADFAGYAHPTGAPETWVKTGCMNGKSFVKSTV